MIGGVLRVLSAGVAGVCRRKARHLYARLRWGRDLPALAAYFGTDKWGDHWYAQHYQMHFAGLRRRRLRVLEIGVGGYGDPRQGGESLRMWQAYFPNARIIGLDIADKRLHDEGRIRTVMGSQDDEALLQSLSRSEGPFDIVIDDGSHQNAHVIRSFRILFPLLADNGIYVVEDTQTAYWPEFGGAAPGNAVAPTSMNFLKGLADALNYREFPRAAGWQPDPLGQHIVAMHFFHNLVFVQKGQNDEPSNILDRR
ncbi:MAG TPA: class I SAM-dependent methyltransferase [Burkholderiales bacterium]|nr:class I SAM-dependent methyltransferase [Burkholderiales bacterium]